MPRASVLSFFSGAMGLDIGLLEAGLDVVLGQELDVRAIETIRLNGHRVAPGDLRKLLQADPSLTSLLQEARIEDALFAVVGGPPCQPFSTAGRRLGVADERGLLIFDYIDAVNRLRPRFAILENVKGLLSSRGRSNESLLDEVLSHFAAIGYGTSWGLVDAVNYGAPQFRERLVVIASRDGEQTFVPSPTHFQRHQDPAMRWRTLGDALDGLDEDEPEYVQFSPRIREVLDLVPEGGNWRSLPADVAEEAMGGAWKSGGGKVGFFRRLSFAEPSPTLVTSPIQKATMLAHPTESRPLSVREYARIQGFPDDWEFAGTTADKYKQIGNAVPVALGRALGLMLVAVASGTSEIQTKRRPSRVTGSAMELGSVA